MFYRFWESISGDMLIEITPDLCETGKKAYITDMNDVYLTESGRHMLLAHVRGDTEWGKIDFTEWDITTLYSRGSIEVSDFTLTPSDKSVLNRTIDKEGFDYAMLHYSSYDEVEFNKVDSREFHGLRHDLLRARQKLKTWLAMQGVNE